MQRIRHAPQRRAGAVRLPWPIWLFVFALLLPQTVGFYAGSLLVTSFRVVMIILAVPILMEVAKRRVRLGWPDAFLLLFSLWSLLCIAINYPAGQNVERGGQFILEVTLPFLLARAYFSDLRQIKAVTGYFFIIAMVAFAISIPEAISHQKPILEYTSKLTGIPYLSYDEGTDVRYGLRRAQAFFENPILYGIFCATLAPLLWYSEKSIVKRIIKNVLLVGAAFMSVSSAPLLMLTTQYVMIGIEYATRRMRNRVTVLATGSVILFVALELFTKSGPLGILINYFTFNQISSYARILIWDYGLDNIMRHPIFGMIPENWERAYFMSVSIDNFWIYTGIISGFVGWGLLSIAVVLHFRRFNRVQDRLLDVDQVGFRRSWSIMMVAFAFTGFSVMFFGKLQPYFYFMLGMGGAAAVLYEDRAKRLLGARRAAQSAPPASSGTGDIPVAGRS